MARTLFEYQVAINNGPTHTFKAKTSKYELAAMAALAMLDYEKHDEFDMVKIWTAHLLPDYGPYFYFYGERVFGIVVGDNLRKW